MINFVILSYLFYHRYHIVCLINSSSSRIFFEKKITRQPFFSEGEIFKDKSLRNSKNKKRSFCLKKKVKRSFRQTLSMAAKLKQFLFSSDIMRFFFQTDLFLFYFITNIVLFFKYLCMKRTISKVIFKFLIALVEFFKPIFTLFFDQELFIQQLIFNFWRRQFFRQHNIKLFLKSFNISFSDQFQQIISLQ